MRGIIPARAGFTLAVMVAGALDGDHPRTRGVYAWPAVSWAAAAGSSPHARGLHATFGTLLDDYRIIPARAGFTSAASWSVTPTGDHPRTRGVYSASLSLILMLLGSSPHARGLH